MEKQEEVTYKQITTVITRFMRPLINKFGGFGIKSTGDGLIVCFSSVVDAFRCTLELQKGTAGHNSKESSQPIQFRFGLHAGDTIYDDDDFFGQTVNLAVRIAALADPGGICVSAAVHHELVRKVGTKFQSLGRPPLRHVSDPPEVFKTFDTYSTELQSLANSRVLRLRSPILVIQRFGFSRGDDEAAWLSVFVAGELSARLHSSKLFAVQATAIDANAPNAPQTLNDALQGEAIAGSSYQLRGSLRREGRIVRIVIQLIDSITYFQIWAGIFDIKPSDVRSSVSLPLLKTAARIEIEIQRHEHRELALNSSAMNDVYCMAQRGFHYYYRRTKQDNRLALTCFEEASAAEPTYATAWAGRAACHFWASQNRWEDEAETENHLATDLALRAVSIDQTLPWARLILAQSYLFAGHHHLALVEARRASFLNPSNPAIKAFLGHALTANGNFPSAISYIRQAFTISPYHDNRFMWLSNLALAYYHSNQYEKALEASREASGLAPKHWLANQVYISSLVRTGKTQEAREYSVEVSNRHYPEGRLQNRLPYKNSNDLEKVLTDLTLAGWAN
jgi:adenylate cyclase